VQLKNIEIKNFRCFSQKVVNLDSKIVLVQGENGTGKSSLLEALHYLCYLRSFRTSCPQDLIQFSQTGFFAKALFSLGDEQKVCHNLQVGFEQKKRSVKLNKKVVTSFKELMDHYRVITLTEDDLFLIKGGPDGRRQFIDQAILLGDQNYSLEMRSFKKVLLNRNSLLQTRRCTKELYELWTEQLWHKSRYLQERRVGLLAQFQEIVNDVLAQTFDEKIEVRLEYRSKKNSLDFNFNSFMEHQVGLDFFEQENRFGRSLFGAHLDDIVISFQGKKSKQFASRGQQKLTVLLLKVAQLRVLEQRRGASVLLLDDFMTDFDPKRLRVLADFLSILPNQKIFTSPSQKGPFELLIKSLGAKIVRLTN